MLGNPAAIRSEARSNLEAMMQLLPAVRCLRAVVIDEIAVSPSLQYRGGDGTFAGADHVSAAPLLINTCLRSNTRNNDKYWGDTDDCASFRGRASRLMYPRAVQETIDLIMHVFLSQKASNRSRLVLDVCSALTQDAVG